jgi:hypothetical protein
MVGIFKNEAGEDDASGVSPQPLSDEQCMKPAKKLLEGSPLGYFLEVRPEVKSRLRSAQ